MIELMYGAVFGMIVLAVVSYAVWQIKRKWF